MSNIRGDLGKLLGSDFVPVNLAATGIDSPVGGTINDHVLDDQIHLSPEQANKLTGALTESDLFIITQARIDGDVQNAQDIAMEVTRAQAAESTLQVSLMGAISAETFARQVADTALQTNIDGEKARAQDAESALMSDLAAETSARQAAIAAVESSQQTTAAALQLNIDAEKARAQGAESSLSSGLSAETSARQAADAAEESARQSADNDIQAQIDAMQGQTQRFFIDFAAEFGTATPTKAQADAWLAARAPVGLTPNVGTAIKNNNQTQSTYNHLFVYYVDPDNDNELILLDDGVDTVSTASASSLGIVRGNGDISVDLNGNMFLNANTATDTIIGNRTLTDAAASSTIVPIAAKSLTAWLQGIRNNVKALLGYFTGGAANAAVKLNTARTIAITGKAAGTATSFDGTSNISINVTALSQTASDYPTLNQNTTGNAATATKLASGVTINVGGSVTGTAQTFNGSAAITIPVALNANTATDAIIGNRTLTDAAASGTIVPIAAKTLTAWLQGIRNNLKALFANKQDKAVSASVITALGLSSGATVDDALVAVANKRKNSFYISDFRTF